MSENECVKRAVLDKLSCKVEVEEKEEEGKQRKLLPDGEFSSCFARSGEVSSIFINLT